MRRLLFILLLLVPVAFGQTYCNSAGYCIYNVTAIPYCPPGPLTWTSCSVTIGYFTNWAADTEVYLGTAKGQYTSLETDPTLTKSHLMTIDGLAPNTTYHMKLRSVGPGTGTSGTMQMAEADVKIRR